MDRLRSFLMVSVVILVAGCALVHPDTARFHATMSGAQQVPPTDVRATATATATLDIANQSLTYRITYRDLTGPATMIHFHAPADAGENAGIRVALTGLETLPLTGQFSLTKEEAEELQAGKWYVNIHTSNNPAGEIRGQLILE